MKPIATKTLAIVLYVGPFVFVIVVSFKFMIPPESEPEWLTVLPISAMPMDGRPILVPIDGPKYDAWQRLPDEFVTNVYARRDPVTEEFKVLAAIHDRLAASVDYDHNSECFHSACFDVRFNIDGAVIGNDPFSMSFSDLKVFPTMVADHVLFVRNINRW